MLCAVSILVLPWVPLPLHRRAKKAPPAGTTGRFVRPVVEQMRAWAVRRARGSVAVRLPEDVLAVDVDANDGKGGDTTRAELERQLGPLPPTPVSMVLPCWPVSSSRFRDNAQAATLEQCRWKVIPRPVCTFACDNQEVRYGLGHAPVSAPHRR